MLRPREDCNPPRLRQPLLEQLDAFAHELDGEIAHAGEIAAGSGPALHQLDIERIAAEAEHDGLCYFQRPQAQHRELLRHDHLGIGCEELAPHSFHIVQSARPEAANRQIAAFAPAQLAQARAQRLEIRRGFVRAASPEPGNAPRHRRLLRARRARPCGRAGKNAYEIAASHVRRTPASPSDHSTAGTATPMPAYRCGSRRFARRTTPPTS